MREPAMPISPRPELRVGQKVRLARSKRSWTVRAVTTAGRFVILTQPFNLQHTVLYSVIDFDRGVRGKDDHYGLGYESDEQIVATLEAFQATEDEAEARGEDSWPSILAAEVSHRSGNHVRLDIEAIDGVPCDWAGRTTAAVTR